jgi:hypothetical protein
MATTMTVTERVRNYQGDNSFVLKMKDSLRKWGRLTEKQLTAVEKCLNTPKVEIDKENIPEDIKTILDYKGNNKFVLNIIENFNKKATLTDKQISMANQQIIKESEREMRVNVNLPTPGQTIKLGRKIGSGLKEKYNLEFNPLLIDITKVKVITKKAVLFTGKMTVKRAKVCVTCLKTLTDEFSMATNMGKICAKKMGIEYITDISQAGKFREEYLKKVEEIGEMEFWVPRSQILKWDGTHGELLTFF